MLCSCIISVSVGKVSSQPYCAILPGVPVGAVGVPAGGAHACPAVPTYA